MSLLLPLHERLLQLHVAFGQQQADHSTEHPPRRGKWKSRRADLAALCLSPAVLQVAVLAEVVPHALSCLFDGHVDIIEDKDTRQLLQHGSVIKMADG